MTLYDRLVVLLARTKIEANGATAILEGAAQETPAASNENKTRTKAAVAAPTAKAHPHTWSEIGIGSLVLATVRLDEGWWEAVVERVDGERLTLRWRDYPEEGLIVRRREQLALLHPGRS